MRFAAIVLTTATTLACTQAAFAQWCDPVVYGQGWCGAHVSFGAPSYRYERATDKMRAEWAVRWTNLRQQGGSEEYLPPVTLLMVKQIDLPPRSCVGATPVTWEDYRECLYNTGGWYSTSNRDLSCTWGFVEHSFLAPPAQAGTFWIANEPCPGEPGKSRTVIRTRNMNQGAGLSYSVSIERLVTSAIGPTGERIGSVTAFTLGPNDSAIVGPCGDAPTTAVYRVSERCGTNAQNLSVLTHHKGPNGDLPTGSDTSSLRNSINTRLRSRGHFRVRTPSAVMGVRGFTAAETVLTGVVPDAAAQVRWQRVLDSAQPQDGIVPFELLEDGPLVGGSSVAGTHGPVLRLTGFTEHDVGTYMLRVIPAGGTIDESTIATTVRVVDDVGQPVFTQEPMPMRLCPSQLGSATPPEFTVAVASSDADDPITYQWFVNGMIASSGAWASNPFGDGLYLSSTSGPRLDIESFLCADPGVHNVIFWLECEATNSHGSARTRPTPLVIDLDTDDCDADGTTDACEIASGAPDANDDGIPDACQCLADLDANHAVDGADLGLMLSQWGPTQPTGTWFRCDLNADGQVDGADLGVLLSGWGACTG